MKKSLIMCAMIFAMGIAGTAHAQGDQDWANYGRYAEANTELMLGEVRPEAVFMGNSITDAWPKQHEEFFTAGNYAGRGISGQVTAQMLARFQADLEPRVVVILAGTNDIARNQGFITIQHIADNIVSMAQLARANGIEPVICSVLPAAEYPWRKEITQVPGKVRALNAMLKEWARCSNVTYVDYFSAMADERDGLPASLASDGIHPTSAGYYMMEGIIKPVLDEILQ